ncbi:MAG: uracil phosphoribosyltransferase [Ureaplasma sp.]|nr:uracil phosphoribosyltransferase [Ureaplasma sp.]
MYKIISHPLVIDKLTRLRKADTDTFVFRQNLKELTQLMFYEATKDLSLTEIKINTPVTKNVTGYKISNPILLVAILRAGLGMVDALKELLPNCSIGHIGLYRNEQTLQPVQYYFKMPHNINESITFICDPMLATGGSAIAAIDLIKKQKPKKIVYVGILGSKYGLEQLAAAHPDIDIYLAGLDNELNDKGYIVPGLGDAGDRIFGTSK